MVHRRTYLRAAALGVAGLAGCADDATGDPEGSGDGTTPTATPTETDSQSATARETYPDFNWDLLDGESPEAATTVELQRFAYDPLVARVPAGEEIRFPNRDSAPHTVTAPALGVDAGLQGGEETTLVVEEPGTYDYVCTLHPPDMLGRLVVEA